MIFLLQYMTFSCRYLSLRQTANSVLELGNAINDTPILISFDHRSSQLRFCESKQWSVLIYFNRVQKTQHNTFSTAISRFSCFFPWSCSFY